MSVRREEYGIRFTDGTHGIIITEFHKGVIDLQAEYEDVIVYYCVEHVGKSWNITRGFDKVNIGETATQKEAIAQIILDVRKNQVRSARTYILTTVSGREFEVVATSEHLAKKAVRFKCRVHEELNTKEIKNVSDETKQKKAKIGEYADFICENMHEPENTIKAEPDPEPEPEYMGIDYKDARRFDNWKKLLFDRIYEGDTEHDEMYAIISGDIKITGFFWNRKGAEQFHRIYGGCIYKIDSLLYYLYEFCEQYLGIINEFQTYEISIESQLIQKGYLHKDQSPAYIFDTLQTYTNQYELDWILTNNHMMRYAEHMYQYCQMVFQDFAKGKDCEKTLQAFCHNMWYLTNSIVAKWTDSVIRRGGEEDDSGKSVAE